jgi:hypothetical protein
MLNNLLTNIKEITKNTRKESHFGRHWGIVAGLEKSIDKSTYSLMPSAEKHSKGEIVEQVLATFSTSLTDKQVNFIERLTNQSLSFLADYRGTEIAIMRQQSIYNKSSFKLIEEIFKILQIYSFSLNSAVGFTELHTTATKPELVKEVIRFNKHREPIEAVSAYRARLTTAYQALIVKGHKNRIDFLLMPVEKAIGLSKSESEYEPITSLTGKIIDGEVEWFYNDKLLAKTHLDSVCMKAFQKLIEKTKESIFQDACFSATPEG